MSIFVDMLRLLEYLPETVGLPIRAASKDWHVDNLIKCRILLKYCVLILQLL